MAFDKHMVLRTVLILVAAVVLFALIGYYSTSQKAAPQPPVKPPTEKYIDYPVPSTAAVPPPQTNEVTPSDPDMVGDVHRPVDFQVTQVPNDCFPKDRISAEDLLPSDASSKWAQVNPAGQGDVKNVNFLTAGFHVGINTTSGSMKNANLQIRSEPPNPKGSWPIMNSSYTPSDLLRRPLEIGGDC